MSTNIKNLVDKFDDFKIIEKLNFQIPYLL